MKTRILLSCGAAAPVVYLGALALGSLSTPGYDPLHQAVSELIAAGAPLKPLLDGLFSICAVMVLLSSLGLGKTLGAAENRWAVLAARTGLWILAGISMFGLVVLAFPMDIPGNTRSPAGLVHTACSCLMCAASLPAVALITIWLYSRPGLGTLARYSTATSAMLFAAGSAAAVVYFTDRAFLGLLERLTFIVFFQWLAVLSCVFWRNPQTESDRENEKEVIAIPAGREKSAGTL